MLHISIFNFPHHKHLISMCFIIRLWGEYDPHMGLSMKVAHAPNIKPEGPDKLCMDIFTIQCVYKDMWVHFTRVHRKSIPVC